MILTKKEIESIRTAFENGSGEVVVSLDLGLSSVCVQIENEDVVFPSNVRVHIDQFKKANDRSCYIVQDGILVKAQTFSKETNRHCKIVPTSDWPTITISGVPMHQKTRVTPKRDAHEKVGSVKVHGEVLDTCTGLGYTAILASKKADYVTTVERDESILKLAELNPYSRELFANQKIEVVIGDVLEVIKRFYDSSFDVVIHDPPTFKLAGELFGREFYSEVYRVLKKSGWMFHYTGRFGIKSGRKFIDEVIKRLREVGFTNIKKVMDEQGVVCQKPKMPSKKVFKAVL